MNKEQRLLYYYDDPSGTAELEKLHNQGWTITQISSVDSHSCWLLLEREANDKQQSGVKEETKIPDEFKFDGHDTIIGSLGEEIRKNSY